MEEDASNPGMEIMLESVTTKAIILVSVTVKASKLKILTNSKEGW